MFMHHDDDVRTTVNIDNDLMKVLRGIAESRRTSLGKVVSDLLRKALRPTELRPDHGAFPLFRVSENAPPITLDDVKRAEEDL